MSLGVLIAAAALAYAAGSSLERRAKGLPELDLGFTATQRHEGRNAPDEISRWVEGVRKQLELVFYVQLGFAVAAGLLIVGAAITAIVLLIAGHHERAAALGGTDGISAVVALRIWQPFEKLGQLRREVFDVNALQMFALNSRMAIARIADPKARANAEAKMTKEFFVLFRGATVVR